MGGRRAVKCHIFCVTIERNVKGRNETKPMLNGLTYSKTADTTFVAPKKGKDDHENTRFFSKNGILQDERHVSKVFILIA